MHSHLSMFIPRFLKVELLFIYGVLAESCFWFLGKKGKRGVRLVFLVFG